MQMQKTKGLRAVTLAALIALIVYIQPFSWGDVRSWSEKAALVAAGMQHPQGAVLALSEQIHAAQPAEAASSTTATTPVAVGATAAATRVTNAAPPPRSDKGGTVVEQMLDVGTPVVERVAWHNRSGETLDIPAQFAHQPDITLKSGAQPQVLIVHTHTSEAYLTYDAGYYNDSDAARTGDTTQSVVAVGEEIARQLKAAGIGVIHDKTVHDSPQYTGAYDRAAKTIQKNLKQYPTIQIVLDIHRDAIMPDNHTKIKPTVTIDGRKAAQVMIIAGAVSTEDQPHPHWQENLRLALQLQNALATRYEGLVRPLSVVASRYNEHLTKGSLLIEVGTDANTVAETLYSGELLGKTLAGVCQTLKE